MLYRSGGNLIITDGAGVKKFDTSEGLFSVTNFVDSRNVGAVVLPSLTATGTQFAAPYVNQNTDTLVSFVNPSATHVFGMLQTVYATSSPGTNAFTRDGANGLWRQVTGTHMDGFHAAGVLSSTVHEDVPSMLHSMVLLTFFVSGGGLYLKDRVVMRANCRNNSPTFTTRTVTRPSTTVNFRLFVGLFV